jgi:hypothetical protein
MNGAWVHGGAGRSVGFDALRTARAQRLVLNKA